jgi:hypothetical protein
MTKDFSNLRLLGKTQITIFRRGFDPPRLGDKSENPKRPDTETLKVWPRAKDD